MRWRGREQSDNVEDRRGKSPKAALGGGGIIALLIILGLKFFNAPAPVQQAAQEIANQMQQPGGQAPAEQGDGVDDNTKEFISVILRDTEVTWGKIFDRVKGLDYVEPKLIIFEGSEQTGCGMGNAGMGPFYCPADETIYIPPSFFDALAKRHNAPGDFAQAYVIAHEVAHHVQKIIGYSDKVNKIRREGNERATNRASVRLELQADFLAGVWAYHAHKDYNIMEDGDMEEAIQAANQIGDDTLGHVPERYTHGTSAQRVRWFKRGMESGDVAACKLLFDLDYDDL